MAIPCTGEENQYQFRIMKFTILKNLIYVPLLWVGLPPETYGILFILMVIDTATGVTASYVIRGKHSIKSHLFAAGITSKLIILTVPFILALTAKGIGMDMTAFVRHSLSLFILSETYSIIGNYLSIKRKEYVAEFDAISFVLEKIRQGLLAVIQKK